MAERRKCKRYPISYPAEKGEENTKTRLILHDVSKGGVAFTSPDQMQENDKFNIFIFLKNRMFKLKTIVVHVIKMKDDIYKIGAQFVNVPKEFHAVLEREIEEITQFHRECKLYDRKDFSFNKASEEYLENTTSE